MMMWPARAAIRPVPTHAVVPRDVIDALEAEFAESKDLEQRIDRAFDSLDERQPALAGYLADEIDELEDDTAQALGHFLGVAVHEAFTGAFGKRVREIDDASVAIAHGSLEADEDLRRGAPDEVLESDDVVAMSQPHMVAFVREQLDAVLEPDEDGEAPEVDLEAVYKVYRAILVEIVALSQAVESPAGRPNKSAN
jgi:hypothetical protein